MLLLLHGALYTQSEFEPLLPLLGERFDVHSFDFAGHGASPVPDGPLSIRGFAEETLRYVDDAGAERADIFGFSMGGYVGLYLAKHHPERIGRVMTLATKLDWTPESAARELRFLNPDLIQEKVPVYAGTLKKRHGDERWRTLVAKIAGMMAELGAAPELPYDQFGSIGHSIRVGVGDRDPMVSIEETLRGYRELPNGQMYVLPGTGHPLESVPPEILAREIIDCMNG